MSELENRLPDTSELGQLKEQCAELRRLATFLLLGLVVLSFTFAFFVGFQVRRTGKDLDAVRPQMKQMLEFTAKEEPIIRNFMTSLSDYARKHPEFQALIAKYRIGTNAPSAASAPASAPK
jgi:hypothetical protein